MITDGVRDPRPTRFFSAMTSPTTTPITTTRAITGGRNFRRVRRARGRNPGKPDDASGSSQPRHSRPRPVRRTMTPPG
jgi:hypothetical protein